MLGAQKNIGWGLGSWIFSSDVPENSYKHHNVGPPFAYWAPITSLGGGLFRIRAMIGRSPIMSFDFGGLKIWQGFPTIPFISIHRDLRTVGAQGRRIENP